MKDNREFRAQVLMNLGANSTEVEELLIYNQNRFQWNFAQPIMLPLMDESHVEIWKEYATVASTGAFRVLQERLLQLQFPIQTGISQTEAYRAATRRGIITGGIKGATSLILQQPEQVQLILHPSLAGTIPVIYTPNRDDFVSLVQALARRNEPQPIPESMGACLVSGFNNWDRIYRYRQQWESQNFSQCSEQEWAQEFQRLIPQKHLYQDRLMILSGSSYSNVSASQLGLLDLEWQRLSYLIRLEHESVHYLTRRLFNSMQNNLLDELIADYWGLVVATRKYRADWFLHFMGLESFPQYREGGRLQNYRGQLPLCDQAFQILQQLVKAAAENLEVYASQIMNLENHILMVLGLCTLTLEELASFEAGDRLEWAFKNAVTFQGSVTGATPAYVG